MEGEAHGARRRNPGTLHGAGIKEWEGRTAHGAGTRRTGRCTFGIGGRRDTSRRRNATHGAGTLHAAGTLHGAETPGRRN